MSATDWGSLKLRKFNLDEIPDDATMCFCAKRHSGKSYLMRDILHRKKSFPAGIVIAPTDKMTEWYTKFVPSVFVHYEYKSELLSNLFKRQADLIERNQERLKQGKKPLDVRAFCIMDDTLSSKGEWAKDPNIAEMFFNGRHSKILFCISMQFPLGLKPEFRNNFDYVFLLSEDFISNQKRLYDHYAGMFPSFHIFRKVLLETTDNYGCLVINNRVKSKDILDKVFWYKASDPGPFMMGEGYMDKYNQRVFDPLWKKRGRVFDVGHYLRLTNKCDVKVELAATEESKPKAATKDSKNQRPSLA